MIVKIVNCILVLNVKIRLKRLSHEIEMDCMCCKWIEMISR
jgi:hypothetical protein